MLLKDALKLNISINDDIRLIAGSGGLHREVKKVGILDHEHGDTIVRNFENGEFVLSTLLIIKDYPNQMLSFVKSLYQADVSCFALKTIHFEEFPPEVIEFANSHDFPIFLFDSVYFEDIITDLNMHIRLESDIRIQEYKVDDLLSGDYNKYRVRSTAYDINAAFEDHHVVINCLTKSSSNKLNPSFYKNSSLILEKNHSIFPYHNNIMLILSFSDSEKLVDDKRIIDMLSVIGITTESFYIGISNFHGLISELDKSINESLYALSYVKIEGINISKFSSLGVNRALLPLKSNPWILDYYDSIISPLIKYDRDNETQLLFTATEYIKCGGDIKKTCEVVFQHPNTIRYRIDKIKKILADVVELTSFYEELAIAIKLHLILTKAL